MPPTLSGGVWRVGSSAVTTSRMGVHGACAGEAKCDLTSPSATAVKAGEADWNQVTLIEGQSDQGSPSETKGDEVNLFKRGNGKRDQSGTMLGRDEQWWE